MARAHKTPVGIGTGFIIFGTLGNRILLALHEHERMTYADLCAEFPDASWSNVSTTLTRLLRNGFIHDVGTQTIRQLGPGHREQRVLSLWPVRRKAYAERYNRPLSQRLSRARAKIKVPSVFEFRGRIAL